MGMKVSRIIHHFDDRRNLIQVKQLRGVESFYAESLRIVVMPTVVDMTRVVDMN